MKDLWYWSKPLLKKKPVNEPKKLTGLICLKGGDLNNEIAESGCRPQTWEIEKIFEEDFFKEKYMLFILPNYLIQALRLKIVVNLEVQTLKAFNK